MTPAHTRATGATCGGIRAGGGDGGGDGAGDAGADRAPRNTTGGSIADGGVVVGLEVGAARRRGGGGGGDDDGGCTCEMPNEREFEEEGWELGELDLKPSR